MYRLKINGKEYLQVQGTEDWSKTITRDFNDRIFRVKGGFEFKAWDGLFDLLYEHIRSQGVCNSLNARIYLQDSKIQDFQEWWRGEIKMQDIEFDLIKDSADAQVLDDVWAAKFANSDKQKVFLRSTKAKKGTSIESCPYSLCDFYDPEDGSFGSFDNRLCFNVFDAFTFLVNYHTDGAVAFASDYFETGDGMKFYLTTGEEIRTGSNDANLEISFNQLFDEMNKKFCLFIIIETDDYDNPVLRIEPQSYVFDNSRALTVNDPENIKMQVDLDQLYTIIKVGSDAVDYLESNANYPNIQFKAWNEEEYNTPGDCEFENNTLDLVSSWKIDTNSIEQQLDGGTDHDDNIFIVEIDTYLQAYQYETDFTSTATVEYIYNYNLRNEEVINNWYEGIPDELIKDIGGSYYLYVDTPQSDVVAGGAGGAEVLIKFKNDSTFPATDPSDIYTVLAEEAGDRNEGEFVIPMTGIYQVSGKIKVKIIAGSISPSTSLTFRINMKVYADNTRANLLRSVYFTPYLGFFPLGYSDYVLTLLDGVSNPSFYFENNNCIIFNIEKVLGASVSWQMLDGDITLNTIVKDVKYNTANTQPLIYQYDISKFKLSVTEFNTLDNNLGFIRFVDTKKNLAYDLWATELKYNPMSQIVEVGKFLGRPPIVECVWLLLNGEWDDDGCWDDNNLWTDPEVAWFIMTVKTDNAGVSAADEFRIPTTGTGYDYVVDWGDGSVTTGNTGTVTHTYSSPGTYTVKILGDFPRIYFNNGGDRLKLLTIEQWGDIAWTNFNRAFWNCSNMDINAIDAPDLSGVTVLSTAFRQCSSMNANIGHWDVSTITQMAGTFYLASIFNNGGSSDINNWDTSSLTTIQDCFRQSGFNQPIGNWDVSGVNNFSSCLQQTSFDQDIGAWDISSATSFANFLFSVSLSTANYDALLTGWTGWSGGAATRSVPAGLTFHAGGSTYSLGTDAEDARTYLDVTQTWTITDGGGV